MLLQFFRHPGSASPAGETSVVTPLQFTPAPPPPRSSSATFTHD
jgi:hypothetical protein